jgi:hypothetical protein
MIENYTVNPQIEEVKYPHNGEHYIDTEDPYHSGRHFLN